MAPTVPNSEPSILVIGDTWTWNKTLNDYSALDGWALSYGVAGPQPLPAASIQVTTNGAGFVVTVASTATAALAAGTYRWQSYATLSGARYTVEAGVFTLIANLAAATGAGAMTHNARMLNAIESLLEGRVAADVESYSIQGRSILKLPFRELMRYRTIYASKVWRENNPGKLGGTVEAVMQTPSGLPTGGNVPLPAWYETSRYGR